MNQEISKIDDPQETPSFDNPDWVKKMEKQSQVKIDNEKE
jgi:hypothetical protein